MKGSLMYSVDITGVIYHLSRTFLEIIINIRASKIFAIQKVSTMYYLWPINDYIHSGQLSSQRHSYSGASLFHYYSM